MTPKAESLFKPVTKQTVMDRTTAESRHITSEETRERNERTAFLKAARLARKALVQSLPQPPSAKPEKAKRRQKSPVVSGVITSK